jgi:NAD(P)-dependent dehydrogenase (short-subunit alcohol dehydrogenase family)
VSETDQGPRNALVTGASRRIGRCIATDLARHGWRVAVHYGSNVAEAEIVLAEIEAAGGHAIAIGADLSDAGAAASLIEACTSALGPLTCLVNNASLFIEDGIGTLDASVWDRQFAVNLRAPVLLAEAFAKHLPEGLQGNVVNIIDQRVLAPTPDFLSYSLAKAGLLTATRMLAQALAPRIRVNGIGPGPVLPSIYQDDAAFAEEVGSTLLGRATAPSEIAAAVRFILDAPSLTGQMIALDAGQHLAGRTAP